MHFVFVGILQPCPLLISIMKIRILKFGFGYLYPGRQTLSNQELLAVYNAGKYLLNGKNDGWRHETCLSDDELSLEARAHFLLPMGGRSNARARR